MRDKLCNYFYNNILSIVWTSILTVGFLIQTLYFFQIEYFPNFTSGSFIYLFVISCFVGTLILSAIISLLILPSLFWRLSKLPTQLTWCQVFSLLMTIILSLCSIILLSEYHSSKYWWLLIVIILITISIGIYLHKEGFDSLKNNWGKCLSLIIITFFLPLYPVMVSLQLLRSTEIPENSLPILCQQLIAILVITLVSYLINYLIVTSKERKSLAITLLAISFSILFFFPKALPYTVATLTKSGNYPASLILKNEGCKTLKAYSWSKHNLIIEGNTCTVQNIQVLSNVGSTTLLHIKNKPETRLEVKNSNIIFSLPYSPDKQTKESQ